MIDKIVNMPRRVKQNPSIFAPLKDNLHKRLSGSNQRLRRQVVKYGFWIAGLFLTYSIISSTYGIPRIIKLELEKSSLIEANRRDLVELIDAQHVKNLLKSDHDFIAYLARTKYHMVYPDETIYRYRGQ